MILRYMEFIYRCIDILMNQSILFNQSSRHNQTDKSMLQKFLSQPEIINILFDREIQGLINESEGLNFFSLHDSLKSIYRILIDTSLLDNMYYTMKVTELTSSFLIIEENLLNVIIYLSNNLANKILSVDPEEVSSEESKLFSE